LLLLLLTLIHVSPITIQIRQLWAVPKMSMSTEQEQDEGKNRNVPSRRRPELRLSS
jgi:hypothetical protein